MNGRSIFSRLGAMLSNRSLRLHFLLACFIAGNIGAVVAVGSQKGAKAWVTGGANLQVDGLWVHMEKDYQDKQQTSFHANVRTESKRTSAIFHGACGSIMPISVSAVFSKLPELEAVLSSGRGADLPEEAQRSIRALRVALQDQCPQVKVMPIRYETQYRTKTPGPVRNFTYDGSLTAENGWKLQDGLQATAYDSERVVKIRSRDMSTVVGVDYEGRCETTPIIALGPMFHNQQEATFHATPQIADYVRFADFVVNEYRKACPAVESIRFSIESLPDNYRCISRKNCFIVANQGLGWKTDASTFSYVPPQPAAIQSFVDILANLEMGNFSAIRQQPKYFRSFYEGFLAIYSDNCRQKLQDPVGRSFRLITKEYDDFGNLIREEQSDPGRPVFIEQSYVAKYDQFVPLNRTWKSALLLSKSMKGKPMTHVAHQWIQDYRNLENRIKGQCDDPKLNTAYKNMLQLANEF